MKFTNKEKPVPEEAGGPIFPSGSDYAKPADDREPPPEEGNSPKTYKPTRPNKEKKS